MNTFNPLRLLPIVAFMFISCFDACSQDDVSRLDNPWEKQARLGVNFNQSSFSKAWKGGGGNNISIGVLGNAKVIYKKERITWSNSFEAQYGFSSGPGGGGLRKNNDKLFLDSKYSYRLEDKWSAFGSVTLLSQFGQGIDYRRANSPSISAFMAPGYLFESIGLEYKPVPYFNVQIGALTVRQTFLKDSVDQNEIPNNYGVPYGKQLLNEVGVQLVVSFDKDLFENVNLRFRYGTMFAYLPTVKPLDHRLDLTVTARVNPFLNMNFTLIGIYDDDIISDIQLSQGLSLGLTASFGKTSLDYKNGRNLENRKR